MLTPERIESIFLEHGWHWSGKPGMYTPIGHAIEAVVRKDDTELIRQLVDALESARVWKCKEIHHIMRESQYTPAILAGRARLEQAC